MNPKDWLIQCLICEKFGTRGDLHIVGGWRMAANHVAGYVCSPECDAIHYERRKAAKEST